MRCKLTYIHHNCFVMETDARTYLFDLPGDNHMPVGHDLVDQAVSGSDLVVFVSHSHEDHLNEDLDSWISSAERVSYVISDDVEEMRPEALPSEMEAVPKWGGMLIVEPDEVYEFEGMRIETLMSNDLGVAFLVSDGDFRFYFGGDLAKWIWKNASDREQTFTSNFFREAMERVHAFNPHVAFSNVDRRLENLAGGLEAYSETNANVFVPMHTFGDTSWLPELTRSLDEEGPELFLYAAPGDSKEYSF